MAFPQSFMDELIARNPIEEVVSEYVSLTRRGSNRFGLCPFHGEKTASFSIAPDKGIYYCFGCHKGGGVVNFIMEIENLDFPDAVRFLAKRANLPVPEDERQESTFKKQERLWALCKDAARFFHDRLYEPAGAKALAYARDRGLSQNTLTRFGLGYAPDSWTGLIDALTALGYGKQEILDAGLALKHQTKGTVFDRFRNRLMFPIIDVRGNVIGFGGRVMDHSEPKYLNSPETLIFNKRKNLFAMNVVKKSKQGQIILCEGYMDAITMHQFGFDCAAASLGTALTPEQVTLLAKYTDKVVLTYDGDEAGQNATQRAIPMLEKAGLHVRVLKMQGAKDPDEFLKKYGAEKFRALLEGSSNQADYRLSALQSKYDLSLDDQRVEFLKKAAELIASMPSAVEREIYGARAAEAAGISAEAMKLETDKAYRRYLAAKKKQEEKITLNPSVQQQPEARSIRYQNTRSALAEEGVLRMLAVEPGLMKQLDKLLPEHFSVPMFTKVFSAFREQFRENGTISVASLADRLSAEEMSHLTAVLQKGSSLVNESALSDYVNLIISEAGKTQARSETDLMAMREQMRKKKGLQENV